MWAGIDLGSVIDSTKHVTIRYARQEALARDVVVVQLDKAAARRAPAGRDAERWQQLRSPHLVEIVAAARTGDGLALALDQAGCVPVMLAPPLPVEPQALFMCQGLEALRVVHEAGHAHGSLGTTSLLLDRDGRARLTMPGITRRDDAFLAPELKRGERSVLGDVFAAGRVLERLAAVGASREHWAAIVGRATATAPGDRFASAVAMRAAIEAAMADSGRDWIGLAMSGLVAAAGTMAASGTSAAAAGPAAIGASLSAGGVATGSGTGASTGTLVAATVAVLALGAGAVAFVVTRDDGSAAATATTTTTTSVADGSPPAAAPAAAPGATSIEPSTIGATTVAATTIPATVPPPTATVETARDYVGGITLPAAITSTPSAWTWVGPAGWTVQDSAVVGDTIVAVLGNDVGGSMAVGLGEGGEELWSRTYPPPKGQYGPGWRTVFASGTNAIVTHGVDGSDGGPALVVVALDAASGRDVWQQQIAGATGADLRAGPGGTIIVSADVVDESQEAVLEAADGRLVWDRLSADVFGSAAALTDNRLVVTSWRDNNTYVVDVPTGQTMQKLDAGHAALSGQVLYTLTDGFCETDCVLRAQDTTSGSELWERTGFVGTLVMPLPDGAIIVEDRSGATSTWRAIEATGAERWSAPACTADQPIALVGQDLVVDCGDRVVLVDVGTGAVTQGPTHVQYFRPVVAAGRTMYTVEQSQIVARSLDGSTTNWTAALPAGFAVASSPAPTFVNAAADGHHVMVGGTVGSLPALAVVSDKPFTQAVAPDIVAGADVTGWTPFTLADGTKAIVLTRRDPGDVFADGTVELAVERPDGWQIVTVIEQPAPVEPVAIGDVDGDGVSEIAVTTSTPSGSLVFDVLYRIDPNGPTLRELPFVGPVPGVDDSTFGSLLVGTAPGHVTTHTKYCQPDCADDPGFDIVWVLDRSDTWSLVPDPANPPAVPATVPTLPTPPAVTTTVPVARPTTAPPAVRTLCVRSNIDFAALRSAPSLDGDLLAQIPPGSCDVALVASGTVQGSGLAWNHVRWQGIDGWTAASNMVH